MDFPEAEDEAADFEVFPLACLGAEGVVESAISKDILVAFCFDNPLPKTTTLLKLIPRSITRLSYSIGKLNTAAPVGMAQVVGTLGQIAGLAHHGLSLVEVQGN